MPKLEVTSAAEARDYADGRIPRLAANIAEIIECRMRNAGNRHSTITYDPYIHCLGRKGYRHSPEDVAEAMLIVARAYGDAGWRWSIGKKSIITLSR